MRQPLLFGTARAETPLTSRARPRSGRVSRRSWETCRPSRRARTARGKRTGPRPPGAAGRTTGIRRDRRSRRSRHFSAKTSSRRLPRATRSLRASCVSSPACRRTGTCCARRTGPFFWRCASSARETRARWQTATPATCPPRLYLRNPGTDPTRHLAVWRNTSHRVSPGR